MANLDRRAHISKTFLRPSIIFKAYNAHFRLRVWEQLMQLTPHSDCVRGDSSQVIRGAT